MLIAAVWLRIAEPPFISHLRTLTFDAYQRLAPRAYQPMGVRIVDLDDASLSRLGQWPWPRTEVARLLRRLIELGAVVIGFDVVFAEPDRTSPANILPVWRSGGHADELERLVGGLPDHDSVFAAQVTQSPVVTGFVLVGTPTSQKPMAKAGWASAGDDPLRFLPDFAGAVVTLPLITEQAMGNGSFNFFPDRDGVVRRVPMVFRMGTQLYPSLSAETLRVALGARTIVVKSSGANQEESFGEHTGIVAIKIGDAVVPTDGTGQVWLHDTGHVADRYVPAWRVFEPDFDRGLIEGHIVLVGTSAPGLKDLRTSPLAEEIPGIEIHAQMLEQIALGDYLLRPDWTLGAEVVYVAALGLAMIVLVEVLGTLWVAGIGVLFMAAAAAASWLAYMRFHWLLDPVYPVACLLIIYLSAAILHFTRSERERRWVRSAFSLYLSPHLVAKLTPGMLRLGGQMKPMTLMFCDIRDFTTISEQFDPQGLTHVINSFLTPMTRIIQDRMGTIDKYIGDCIMAFWNAPLDDPDHARHACRSALAMLDRLEPLNEQLRREAETAGRKFHPLAIGIGLNTGECCVGNMGSDQRLNYSVLGDTVNLASRLEGQSKNYGVSIVLSDETRAGAPEMASLELDLIMVKGKTTPVRIFTLLGDTATRQTAAFQAIETAHEAMLAAYRTMDFAAARQRLEDCRTAAQGRLERLYAVYEERIEAYLSAPPPSDWDGVFVATSK